MAGRKTHDALDPVTALMFYQLPPVGNPVYLTGTGKATVAGPDFIPYTPSYYASGTAALAAAITAAIRLKRVSRPEIILPAYGCPDLVSAAVFAGAKPVLADLVPERPWMDPDRVSACINSRTVAIVAVSLFGIPERMDVLRQVADRHGVVLIEDSAQAFPTRPDAGFWSGDLVVLSFGRGKPVSLLGGGAVLFRDRELGAQLAPAAGPAAGAVRMRVRAAIYNLMISPRLYWIPQNLPFLHLGVTRFVPLTAIAPMEPLARRSLSRNINKYQEDKNTSRALITEMLGTTGVDPGQLLDLPAACRVTDHVRLLRYPLLVEPLSRDRCLQRLRRAGLGPSCMYPAVLPGIPGLETLLSGQGSFPAAADFATRILTLPTHRRVRHADIIKMGEILCACLR